MWKATHPTIVEDIPALKRELRLILTLALEEGPHGLGALPRLWSGRRDGWRSPRPTRQEWTWLWRLGGLWSRGEWPAVGWLMGVGSLGEGEHRAGS